MNLTKSKTLILTFFLILPLSLSAQLKGDTFAKAKATKTANVIYVTNPLSIFCIEKNGQYSGITVEIMKDFEVFVKEKYNIDMLSTYVKTPNNDVSTLFSNMKASVGGVFPVTPIVVTNARKKIYDFSPPYMAQIEVVISQKSAPTINKIEEMPVKFANKTVYTVKGSANEKFINTFKKSYFPKLKITYVELFDDLAKSVATDPNSFIYTNFLYYATSKQYKEKLKIHFSTAKSDDKLAILLSKGNDWTPIFNEFMNSGYLESNEYKLILRKYLGEKSIKLIESFN